MRNNRIIALRSSISRVSLAHGPNCAIGKPAPRLTTAAFAVHIFTACGAACALLALIAAVRSDWPQMFVWLGIALFIDGVDGTFARRLRVAEVLPRWSGDVLDLVVDILTYVFVPAYAIAASGLLPMPRDSARHPHRRHRFALFRRPADEDVGLLFPRLPGAVERGGVLPVPAQTRAMARGSIDCRRWRR